jgi:hypothetical protein
MYLIVKCEPLNDQYECEADRTPICLTEDYSSYGRGYEVYEVMKDNSLKLIKEYDEAKERGIAIFISDDFEDFTPKHVYEKFSITREEVTAKKVKKWKSKYHLEGSVEEILSDIRHCGRYGEDMPNGFLIIGEYSDDVYYMF